MAPDPLCLCLMQTIDALSVRVESHLAEIDLSHPLLAPVPEEKAKRAAKLEAELLGAIDDSEIVASALERLQNVRGLILERRQRVQRAKAGITALPPEILQKVFLALVNDHILDPIKNPFCGSARIISHVCAQWRQIAIEQSALWRKIDLGAFNQKEFALKIERAGPVQPLILAFHADDLESLDLVDVVQDHANRWEAIDIFASSCARSDLCLLLNGLGLHQFSSLRHLSVVGPGRGRSASSREIRLGSRNNEKQSWLPRLSYLSTSHVRFGDFENTIGTLTTLTVKDAGYSAETWLTVLRRCENLHHLTIIDENVVYQEDPFDLLMITPTTLPHLKTLSLSKCSPRTLQFMFHVIHAPEVLTVSVDFPLMGRLEGRRVRSNFVEALDHFVCGLPYKSHHALATYTHSHNYLDFQYPARVLKWRA